MFKLVTIEDIIMVPAHLFGVPRLTALEHMVNKRFSDRVIAGHGLCVALWDFVTVGEDRLVVASGESSTSCVFRVVVFCPFAGEVVFGSVSASHAGGIFVQLGFFDAVHIGKEALPRPSDFDEKENVWIWRPQVEAEEGVEGAAQTLYMDATNECVFRVERCDFEDGRRVKPADKEAEGSASAMSIVGMLYDEAVEDNQGLGDPLWWYEGDDSGGGEEEQGGEEGYEDEAGGEETAEGGYEEWEEGEKGGEGDYEENGEDGENGEEFEEEGEEGCGMVDDADD